MRKIVVVGSLNMDLVTTVERMPREGETIRGTSFGMYAGGKGANQAVAAARLGGDVAMVGAIGKDPFGDTLLNGLTAEGIDAGAIERVDGSTGCATILVAANGSNSIVVNAGANAHLHPEHLQKHWHLLQQASNLLCQLETPLDTVSWLCRSAAELQIPIVLDPAPMILDAASVPFLQHVTWLTPNETETSALLSLFTAKTFDLSSDDGIEHAAEVLLQHTGARNVALKRGSRGAYLCGADCRASHVPAVPVDAVDTTAAGDTFNGAFACALAKGTEAADAAAYACKAASLSTQRHGAQASMPTAADLEAWKPHR